MCFVPKLNNLTQKIAGDVFCVMSDILQRTWAAVDYGLDVCLPMVHISKCTTVQYTFYQFSYIYINSKLIFQQQLVQYYNFFNALIRMYKTISTAESGRFQLVPTTRQLELTVIIVKLRIGKSSDPIRTHNHQNYVVGMIVFRLSLTRTVWSEQNGLLLRYR